MEYEQALSARFRGRRIVALCSYAPAQCNDQQMGEVTHAHNCALEGPDGYGKVVAIFGFLGAERYFTPAALIAKDEDMNDGAPPKLFPELHYHDWYAGVP